MTETKSLERRANAYDVKWEGRYEFNPEYVPMELEKALLWAVHSAKDSKVPTFGIGILIFPACDGNTVYC
eukprot:1181868-Prorocentrum_minimum.AAC.3